MNRRKFLKKAAVLGALTAAAATAAEDVLADDSNDGGGNTVITERALSLDGAWAFRADAARQGAVAGWPLVPLVSGTPEGWAEASVPGCWERDGQPGTLTGPAWYRKDVVVPAAWRAAGNRLWWECDAVSYHAEGWACGRSVGTHTGMWDAFAWEVPQDAVRENGTLPLALAVEKPGGKTFPVRETMAGFLPYVWGTWGGPWQSSRLRVAGPVALRGLWATGTAAGIAHVEADIDVAPESRAATKVRFDLRAPNGRTVALQTVTPPDAETPGEQITISADLSVRDPLLWETFRPALYTLHVSVLVGEQVSDSGTRRIGFRDIATRGETLYLNSRPLFFRAPLSWGWYETERAPNPSPEVFAEELRRVRALGFNGMKLCLWIPPASYFDVADALGMLLWVELPMWLPEGTPFCRKQTPEEYRRIVRQIGDHPSIAVWTIGCEIGRGVDAEFLGSLYAQVKEQTASPLVRDNSGSAECYGGPLPEHADYWDFHLYCDLPFARPTFDAFSPRWREKQPFLFGEFNDQDALRDLPGIIRARNGDTPWWARNDRENNPQGVRWEYNVVAQTEKMQSAGLLGRVDELRASSRKQALLTRKHTLELTRSYPFLSGYVVTGLADTPISTAGLFDDFGTARFTSEEFTAFNADTVLLIEPDRRRAWTAGGDRASFLDRYGVWSGEPVRHHVGVSHYGREIGKASLRWTATRPDGSAAGEGRIAVEQEIIPGDVREIGLIEFDAPTVKVPERMILSLTMQIEGGRQVTNAWPVWVYPKIVRDAARRVGLLDPAGHLSGFAGAVGIAPVSLAAATGEPVAGGAAATEGPAPVVVATIWRPEMRMYLQNGGNALLVQPGASDGASGDGLPATALPFWREAMRLFAPHDSWGGFPHEKWTDFLFYGLAGDAAFDRERVQAVLGPQAVLTPILTRVDARSFAVHDYALSAQVGRGTLLMTTLRPHGGLGDQPSGLARHVAGTYLLRTWLDWLEKT